MIAQARIGAVATYLPEDVLDNATLARNWTDWDSEKIFAKTGIAQRHIAATGQTALDMGEAACRNLFADDPSLTERVDFLIFCSQAPDYILPTSACLLQDRLGLSTSIGALDINLGCSGFVYGLSLASSLIASGQAHTIILVTADTYSKFIHQDDKSVRTLFGDGAAATVIEASEYGGIGPFIFGTDGAGGGSLIVEAGGARLPRSSKTGLEVTDRSGNIRSQDNLFMDGGAVLNFTLKVVPKTMKRLLEKSNISVDEVDLVLLHQANKFMLDALQRKLGLPDEKMPRLYEMIGNTVSSTIPFVWAGLARDGRIKPGMNIALIGFGVGLSWAACVISL